MNSTLLKIIIIITLLASVTAGSLYAYQIFFEKDTSPDTNNSGGFVMPDKPIIYLYPEKTQDIKVDLDFNGRLTSTYPDYGTDGWEVTAHPDGSLTNHKDGNEYSYLFWEGISNVKYPDLDTGFVVKGSDTMIFLQNTLSKIGLTPKEYNEMIVYWLPQMENNKYNLIHFAGQEYTQNAKLDISPKPDSILRVFMVFQPLDRYQEVKPQEIKPFQRKGFTVVEWGGTKLK